jgi:hypothetical protein
VADAMGPHSETGKGSAKQNSRSTASPPNSSVRL